MSIYEAETPEALRAEVVALCVEMGKITVGNTTRWLTEHAERIVPKVPVPAAVYNEYKCVMYRDGYFWWEGNEFMSAAELIVSQDRTFTDEDHAALMDLKANPVVVPVPVKAPVLRDHKGVTYRDGKWRDSDGETHKTAAECIYFNSRRMCPAMQVPLTDDDHAHLMALKANPLKDAPVAAAPVEYEPCGFVNVCANGDKHCYTAEHRARAAQWEETTEIAVPIFRVKVTS